MCTPISIFVGNVSHLRKPPVKQYISMRTLCRTCRIADEHCHPERHFLRRRRAQSRSHDAAPPERKVAAGLLLRAVTVPLYTTLTPEQTAFVLQDSGCRAIFLSSDQQLRKVLSILPQTSLEKIVVMDHLDAGDLVSSGAKCVTLDEMTRKMPPDLGAEVEAQ